MKEEVKEILLHYYEADYYPQIWDDYAEQICQLLKIPPNPYGKPPLDDTAFESIWERMKHAVFEDCVERFKELNK